MKTFIPTKHAFQANYPTLEIHPRISVIKKQLGVTLVNLLTTLIISGLLSATGIPAISQTYYQQRVNSAYEDLFTLIQFTRIQALSYHTQIILCPTTDNIHCVNDWSAQLMVFVDSNNDETYNNDEELLRYREALHIQENIKWDTSGSRRYLRFKNDGSTGNQNGRLSYCLSVGNKLYTKQIIMYRSGRARRGNTNDAIKKCRA